MYPISDFILFYFPFFPSWFFFSLFGTVEHLEYALVQVEWWIWQDWLWQDGLIAWHCQRMSKNITVSFRIIERFISMLGDCIQCVEGLTGNELKTLLTVNIRCKLFSIKRMDFLYNEFWSEHGTWGWLLKCQQHIRVSRVRHECPPKKVEGNLHHCFWFPFVQVV